MTYPSHTTYGYLVVFNSSHGPKFKQKLAELEARRIDSGKDKPPAGTIPLDPTEECLYQFLDTAQKALIHGRRRFDINKLYNAKIAPDMSDYPLWQAAFDDAMIQAIALFTPSDPDIH